MLNRAGKQISRAPRCFDEFWIARVVFQFAAQAADLRVDAAVEDVAGAAAFDFLEQLIPGQNDIGMFDERREQCVFGCAEGDDDTVAIHDLAFGTVQHPATEAHALTRSRALSGRKLVCAAQDCVNTRQEFARAEGLGDIVVGADFEADYAVKFFGAGAQQDHRRLAMFAHAAAQAEPVLAGHHDVENYQVDFTLTKDASGGRRGLGKRDLQSVVLEVTAQGIANVAVVVNEQNVGNGVGHGDAVIITGLLGLAKVKPGSFVTKFVDWPF